MLLLRRLPLLWKSYTKELYSVSLTVHKSLSFLPKDCTALDIIAVGIIKSSIALLWTACALKTTMTTMHRCHNMLFGWVGIHTSSATCSTLCGQSSRYFACPAKWTLTFVLWSEDRVRLPHKYVVDLWHTHVRESVPVLREFYSNYSIHFMERRCFLYLHPYLGVENPILK